MIKANLKSIIKYKMDGEVPSHWMIVAILMGVISEHKLAFKKVWDEIDLNKIKDTAIKGRFGRSEQTDLTME